MPPPLIIGSSVVIGEVTARYRNRDPEHCLLLEERNPIRKKRTIMSCLFCVGPYLRHCLSVAYRGGVWGVQTPPKFRRPCKIVSNSTRLWKLLKIAEFRKPAPQDVRKKKGSKILKLPPVRNCFTLAMTNKLVVIINSLKVPKIKTILPNYSCLQNPWLGGYRPPDPRFLCPLSSTEFVNLPSPNKIPWYATAVCAPPPQPPGTDSCLSSYFEERCCRSHKVWRCKIYDSPLLILFEL